MPVSLLKVSERECTSVSDTRMLDNTSVVRTSLFCGDLKIVELQMAIEPLAQRTRLVYRRHKHYFFASAIFKFCVMILCYHTHEKSFDLACSVEFILVPLR
jgi:hypothetical protein